MRARGSVIYSDSSRNIAYIFSEYPVLAEYFHYLEIEGLREQGWNVHVFTLRPGNDGENGTEKWNLPEGFLHQVSYTSSRMWLRSLKQWVRHPRLLIWLLALYVRRMYSKPIQLAKTLVATAVALSHVPLIEELEIKIIHGPWGEYPSVGAFVMHIMRPSTVFTMTLVAYDYDGRFALIPDMVEASRLVFVVCEARKRQVINEWPKTTKPVACVYQGVEISPDLTAKAARLPIIAVGTLSPYKGYDVLVRALTILELRGIRFRAKIIGGESPRNPSYSANLREQARDLVLTQKLDFAGPLPHDQVLQEIAESELFVLPSLYCDVLPNAVKEALSLKVPVIVTPTVGIEELIQHKRSGLIVPKNDPVALADALEWALQNPEQMKRMAISGHSILSESFDIDKLSVQRSDYFKELITEVQH